MKCRKSATIRCKKRDNPRRTSIYNKSNTRITRTRGIGRIQPWLDERDYSPLLRASPSARSSVRSTKSTGCRWAGFTSGTLIELLGPGRSSVALLGLGGSLRSSGTTGSKTTPMTTATGKRPGRRPDSGRRGTVLRALSMAWMLLQMCTQSPENIKACMTDQHVWLWPEVWRGVELYMQWELPYQEEADRLRE